jgi:phospholipid/cholesterol/gamma-HCH transport system permease protein
VKVKEGSAFVNPATETQRAGTVQSKVARDGTAIISIMGRLDANTTGEAWRDAMRVLEQAKPPRVILDASRLEYCDGAGVALLLELQRHQTEGGGDFVIRDLQAEFHRLLDLYGKTPVEPPAPSAEAVPPVIERLGLACVRAWEAFRTLLTFVGELAVALLQAAMHPRQIRWKDAWLTAERAGVDALPIIGLIGFLLGLIMAFQSAIPMRQFGADIYVANLIGLSMLRELGPLLTAIVLAGRSGSAFAAEIGTMKVKEEIDALTTMGLEPVRFLIVPRVIAAVAITPVLAVFANLFGLIGGAVVMRSLGFPLVTYMHQIQSSVVPRDLLGGLFKSLAFGLVVAAIGCLRGLQTGTGASAVGEATTSAVVSGLVLITIVDGVFAVVFYYLGI